MTKRALTPSCANAGRNSECTSRVSSIVNYPNATNSADAVTRPPEDYDFRTGDALLGFVAAAVFLVLWVL